jgi:hypothetical protein
MTDDRDRTAPEPNDDGGPGSGLILGVVAGVCVMLAALLGVSLLTGNDDDPATVAPAVTVEESLEDTAPPAPSIVVSLPERIDPALTAWNEEHGPTIGKLYAVLAAPPVRDMTLLRFRCKQMLEPLASLETAPRPQNTAVAEAFDLWLRAVRDAVTFCLEASQELSEADALPVTGSNLGSTGMFWDAFFQEMAKHVDLTGRPGSTPETLP